MTAPRLCPACRVPMQYTAQIVGNGRVIVKEEWKCPSCKKVLP